MSEAMVEDNGQPQAAGQCGRSEDGLKFRSRILGPFEMIKRQAKYEEMSPEWQLEEEEEEYLVEMGVDDDDLKRFAGVAGVEHLDRGELLTVMRVYEVRKSLHANVNGQHFISLMEEAQTNLLVPEQRDQPEVPVLGAALSREDVAELVQPLVATKLGNERLRSTALLDRSNSEPEKLLGESLPYVWMQSLVVGLKDYALLETHRASHPLAKSMWAVVHKELRNKRQGRNSAMPVPQPGGQAQGQGAPT